MQKEKLKRRSCKVEPDADETVHKVRVGVEFACYLHVEAKDQDEAEEKARQYVADLKVKDGGDAIYDWLGEATHIHDTYEVEEAD